MLPPVSTRLHDQRLDVLEVSDPGVTRVYDVYGCRALSFIHLVILFRFSGTWEIG